MTNKKFKIIGIATAVIVICAIVLSMKFIGGTHKKLEVQIEDPKVFLETNNLPKNNIVDNQANIDIIDEADKTIEDVYEELLEKIKVDDDYIIVNPTLDEETGEMYGENIHGDFLQTPPTDTFLSEEAFLRKLFEVVGITDEELIEAEIKDEMGDKYIGTTDKEQDNNSNKNQQEQKDNSNKGQNTGSTGNNDKPTTNTNNQQENKTENTQKEPWEEYPMIGIIGDGSNVIRIEPGTGSGSTGGNTKFE